MNFLTKQDLLAFFVSLGVTKAYFKMLSENDNSKQQVYLGGSFSVLQQLPFGEIQEYPDNKDPNYKAKLDFYWIDERGEYSQAKGAQLILYPKYPEVRLSGFMIGCKTAPTGEMNPVPKENRMNNNTKDGRVLFFGITNDKKVFAYLAKKDTSLANIIFSEFSEDIYNKTVLLEFPLNNNRNENKESLIIKLSDLVKNGWVPSSRMHTDGIIRTYNARNAGGYTMEASFGIIPNGTAEPDYKGWELKAFSGSTLTLMTPEPDKGLYREIGAKEFAIRYGHDAVGYIKYFTGPFRCNAINDKTGLTMILSGYDSKNDKITAATGGIFLVDKNDQPVAIWSFSSLLKHWCTKHAHTCYMKYKKEKKGDKTFYKYLSPVLFGEGTNFTLFLKAMSNQCIIYDPGISVKKAESGGTKGKARSQFRISVKNLNSIYENFYSVEV